MPRRSHFPAAGWQIVRRESGHYLQQQREDGSWIDRKGPYQQRGSAMKAWQALRPRQKPRYFAVSAVGEHQFSTAQGRRVGMEWFLLAGPCATRAEAAHAAEQAIGPICEPGASFPDLERQTLHMNLAIVSASRLPQFRLSEEDVWQFALRDEEA